MPAAYRAQAKRWYSSGRWQRRRAAQIRDEPLCTFCLRSGRCVPAKVADHIKPHKGNEYLFWHGVLQSLCWGCHRSDKALIEHGRQVVEYGEDGWPT